MDSDNSNPRGLAVGRVEEPLVATTITIHSGNNQTGTVGTVLGNPFIVEVRDQNDDLLSGGSVTFTVISGGGSLKCFQ